METIVDGLHIKYEITGQGEPVVVLQGWGTKLEIYQSVADCLSSRYRVIRLDLPGFGGSEEPKEAWAVEDYVEFLLHFLEPFGLERVSFIGHSYGGRMIIRLASREKLPFTVTKLVLIDSAGILPEKTAAQKRKIRRYKRLKKIAEWKIAKFFFGPMLEEWKSRQGSADYRAASPRMRECLVKAVNEDLTPLLPAVRQETLLIWGENDTSTPLSDGKTMERLMPNAGLVTLPGAGHFSFLDQPYVFARVMKSFYGIE
ncbi:MAG: alpha/beta fold hydrolase [Lachnospiraceae bacterium]